MSVKELLVDSWSNMLKNNFILKTILVSLAAVLIYIVFGIVVAICAAIHWALGCVAIIAAIVLGYPIFTATTKVLLDVFQGRDAKVFGFVGYGYKNLKKMWAILGRKILKMLVLYILIIALTVGMIGYIAYNVFTLVKSVTAGYSTELNSSLEYNLDDEDYYSGYSDGYYYDSSDTEDVDLDWEDLDLSAYGIDESQFNGLISENPNTLISPKTSTPSFDIAEFWEVFGPKILQHLAVIGAFCVAYCVVYVLFIMRSLYYTYAYVCAFEDDSLTALQAVERSEELMQGNRGKYFWVLVLLTIIYEIVLQIVASFKNAALVGLLALVLMVLYTIYVQSYVFTFFNKISSKGTVAPEGPAVETPVEPEPIKEPEATEEKTEEPEQPEE